MLSSEKVSEVFEACLFKDEELKDGTPKNVPVEGISIKVGFHPERLAARAEEIKGLLMELPDEFHKTKGGGMSFLNACNDKQGNQWTGFHQVMDQLFMLGIGVGAVQYCAPRDMWAMLPGGMPYYVVDAEPK